MRRDYAKPFADLFRPLTAAERAELRDSIRAHGVRYAAKVYLSDLHGWAVIDGANRLDVCGELGIDCPVEDLGELNEDTARDLAEQLNHARRHLTPDDWRQMAAKAAERRQRVVEKRQEGKSLRTIAEEEGVSLKTVRDDLETSGVPPRTPEQKPERIVGKDGKEYRQPPPADTDDDIGETLDLFDTPDDAEPVSQDDDGQADNSTDEHTELPQPQYLPPNRKGKPPPPKFEYPEPMGSILDGLTTLSGQITRFLNSDLPEAERIREYIGVCRLGWVNYTRSKIVNGKKINPNWRAFQAVRALFRQGYRDRNLKKPRTEQFLRDLMNEEGGDTLEVRDDATAEE